MTPLKNTDKHFSDYLPPALVKDWRQCFRSRSALLIFILLELAGWLMFFTMQPEAGSSPELYLYELQKLGGVFYGFGLFALCFAIPYRACLTVTADTRVRSSNFLMLTPLSARRIVWGTWCSTALMVLLAALCALPLLAARQVMMGVAPGTTAVELAAFNGAAFMQDALALAWLVLCGWVMVAFYMAIAGLPRLMSVGAFLFCLVLVLDSMGSLHVLERIFGIEDGVGLEQLPTILLYSVDALLLLVLFLELARRHYAAPAENCSRSVRLLALAPWLPVALMEGGRACGLMQPVLAHTQAEFALIVLFAALLADALLPTYAVPAHAWRFWRWLPVWCQKPGLMPSALCLAVASPFVMLPDIVNRVWGSEWQSMVCLRRLLYEGVGALNFGFTLLLWLLITDCLCRRSSVKRPVVFGLVALACTFVATCLRLPLEDLPVWESLIPLAGTAVSWELNQLVPIEESILACSLNGGALFLTLLLLIFWRGRVRKS